MPAIVTAAADRLNRAAGFSPTGAVEELPPHQPATELEVIQHFPSEFGGLTHLFGGEAAPSQQYEPVNPALEIPGGSRPGALGGLVPDFRSVAARPVAAVKDVGESAAKVAPISVPAISATAKNYWTRVRKTLGI